uniref:Uncharacterized protein n=1 Tax=Brassica oleracea TaxID=3712 RepID=A0A3P6CZQ4_BRAOL|nr:unnamed protein product [Brassica oleracea]
MRRIMRMRGRRRNVAGGGGSGGRNGGRIRRDRETNRRTAMDLAVINELPVKPIGLGTYSLIPQLNRKKISPPPGHSDLLLLATLQQAISEISSFPFSYILIITNSTPESFHRNHHEISSAEKKVRERFQIKPPSTAKDQTTQILKPAVHLKARYNAGVKKQAVHREKGATPESEPATPRRGDHRVPESVPS